MHWNEKHKKDSQTKGELQLLNMNKTINFISEKFDEFGKDRREKDEIIKNVSKKPIWFEMAEGSDKLENLVDRQEQYSRRNYLLVHGSVETSDENADDLKTINEKLDIDITEKRIDRSNRIGRRKRMDRDQDQLLLN